MKLQLKCDTCGKVAGPDEIETSDDGSDLCRFCLTAWKLDYLKREYNRKKEWLENTHLKNLRELKAQIEELENSGTD